MDGSLSNASTTTAKPVVLDLESDSDNDEKSSSDSDFFEVVVPTKRRKVAVPKFDITTRLEVMGYTVPEFELVKNDIF